MFETSLSGLKYSLLRVLNKIPTWERKTMNKISTRGARIYWIHGKKVLCCTHDCRHHWNLGSPTPPSLFMVTRSVIAGLDWARKKGKKEMKITHGGCCPPSFVISPVPVETCRRQPHSQLKSPHRTSHTENQEPNAMDSQWTCRSGYLYPVMSLKNYHCHLSIFKNVSVCFSSLIYFLFSINHIRNFKIAAAPDKRETVRLHLEVTWRTLFWDSKCNNRKGSRLLGGQDWGKRRICPGLNCRNLPSGTKGFCFPVPTWKQDFQSYSKRVYSRSYKFEISGYISQKTTRKTKNN